MPEWLFIILVTVASLCVTFCFFYFCFDSWLQKVQSRSPESRSNVMNYEVTRIIESESDSFLIYDQFGSSKHDIVMAVLSNSTKCVGIAVFLQDRKVRYFSEEFPACCLLDIDGDEGQSSIKTAFAALHCWRDGITMAESIELIVDDKDFVLSSHDKNSLICHKLSTYEDQFDFKRFNCHWMQNYICDVVSLLCFHEIIC